MERRNWIWFVVAFLALAAFAVCVMLLRSGSKSIAPELAAPPLLHQDDGPAEQPASEPAPEPYAPAPGALDLYSLHERLNAGLRRAKADGTMGLYPLEETELIEAPGAQGLRFVLRSRQASARAAGEKQWTCRDGTGGEYQISEAGEELRLCGYRDGEDGSRSALTFLPETVPAFLIASGGSCLCVEGERFRASDANLATRWAEEPDTGFWYTLIGGRKRYLNSDGLGDRGLTRWSLDGDVLRGTDTTGNYELYFDGDWMLTAPGAFFLADGEGRCFNIDVSGVLPDTAPKTRWVYDNDTSGPGGYFRTYLDGRRYTLCIQDGVPALSTEPYTDYWVYQGGNLFLTKDGVTYYLNFRAGAWRAEPMTGWRISDGEHYLSASDGAVTVTEKADSAAVWRIEDAPGGAVVSTGEPAPLYLGFEENHLTLSAGKRTVWQRGEDSLRTDGGALCFRGGWTLGEADALRFEQVFLTAPPLRELDAEGASKVELRTGETLQLTQSGETARMPAGIAGCVSVSSGADNPGYICAGDSPARLVPLDGTAIEARLPRDGGQDYEQLRGRFAESLASGAWGLRLSGEVRQENLTVLPLARFGGVLIRDCELPENAIDLRLAAGGALRLFSTGGFSLYSVVRDGETGRIAEIRQISRIFRGQDGCVYDYTEGGLPVREGAELIFDTAPLGNPAAPDAVDYFEIPLNAGEYALGGVGTLLYLSVSEQALAAAPESEPETTWDDLSDCTLITFLRDPANAEGIGSLLRSDAAEPLVARAGRIADSEQRTCASELLDALRAGPGPEDWRELPDAGFVQWLCDPSNKDRIRAMSGEEQKALRARADALVSHEDYFLALERLNALPPAE